MSLYNTLAIISQSGCSLSFFNLSTGDRVFQLLDLPEQPHELAYDSKRKLLYISHTYKYGWYFKHGDYCHDISVFDVERQKIVDTIIVAPYGGPHGLRLDRNGDMLFASVEDGMENGGGVIGIDLTTKRIVKAAPSESKAHWFVLTKDGKKAYTTNKEKDYISALNLETGKLAKKIQFPQSEEGDLSLDGRSAYFPFPAVTMAADQGDGFGFKVIDTETDCVEKTVLTKLPVISIVATAQNKLMTGHYNLVYDATLSRSVPSKGSLGLYDPGTLELEGEVEVGVMPLTLRASPDGWTGAVANMFDGTVTMVDLKEMKVLRVLEVDIITPAGAVMNQGAHGMAFIV